MYTYCKYKHDQNHNMAIHQLSKYADLKKKKEIVYYGFGTQTHNDVGMNMRVYWT